MESIIVEFRTSPWIFAFRAPFYFLSTKLAMDGIMTITEALFTFLFGVALPSWDVYSDLIFSFSLIIPRCNYEPYHYYEKHLNWSRKYTTVWSEGFLYKVTPPKLKILLIMYFVIHNSVVLSKILKIVVPFWLGLSMSHT